jgi:hypothetical protein
MFAGVVTSPPTRCERRLGQQARSLLRCTDLKHFFPASKSGLHPTSKQRLNHNRVQQQAIITHLRIKPRTVTLLSQDRYINITDRRITIDTSQSQDHTNNITGPLYQ